MRDLGRGLWRCWVQTGRQKCSVTTQEVKDQGWSAYPYMHAGVHACQELGCSGTPKKRRRSRRIRYSSLSPDEGEKLGHWSPHGRQVVVVMIFLFRCECPLQERQPKSPQN